MLKHRKRRLMALIASMLGTLLMLGVVVPSSVASAGTTSHIKYGGSMTVLFPSGAWPELDAATDTQQLLDLRILNDIDGDLFQQGPNGTIIYDLATSFKFSDHNLVATITLRHGVKFQDGSPFNAQAVAYNINRDLLPANACDCLSLFGAVKSVTASGQYNVVMHLSYPYAPLEVAFLNNAPDEPQSMVAVQNAISTNTVAAYAQHPIGAGPFEIVSMVPNVSVVLKKNPNYWEKGHPYLNQITFESTSSDQSDYEALLTGQAQATGISTLPLLAQIRKSHSLTVNITPTTLYEMVQLNTMKAPFNNLLVREALSYATNPKPIIKNVLDGIEKPTEAFCTSQTNYCPYQKVSTYDAYNPSKAKKLIAQYQSTTGQPFPTIQLYAFTPMNVNVTEAVAQEWEAVGVTVDITTVATVPAYVTDFRAGTWSAWVDNSVDVTNDPATGTFAMFGVNGLLTGADDPTLQSMLNRAEQLVNPATRSVLYKQIFEYLDKNADAIPLYQDETISVVANNVHGYVVGASTLNVQDEDVWMS